MDIGFQPVFICAGVCCVVQVVVDSNIVFWSVFAVFSFSITQNAVKYDRAALTEFDRLPS